MMRYARVFWLFILVMADSIMARVSNCASQSATIIIDPRNNRVAARIRIFATLCSNLLLSYNTDYLASFQARRVV